MNRIRGKPVYCNPLPLPDIPRGLVCGKETDGRQYTGPVRDFRELADPEVLFHDGKWYLYPSTSNAQAYVSDDFIQWAARPLDIRGSFGYAPSIAECGGRFLLTSSNLCSGSEGNTPIYESSSPLGPFVPAGAPRDRLGRPLEEYLDPALFTDDDGRLYLYWGYGPDGGGIRGAELNPRRPAEVLGEVRKLFDFEPSHEWERFGEYNEHPDWSFVEGASMFKSSGGYYMLYAACGTVFRNYAVGCYRADSPLGPFRYQPVNPVARLTRGVVNGVGHGGAVKGPDGSFWLFYTCSIRRSHCFERRIGMDPVKFDREGNASVDVSASPRSLDGDDFGLRPVSVNKDVRCSSWKCENYPSFAVDDCTHTWWEPSEADREPFLEVDFRREFPVSAVRLIWSESRLDYEAGIVPEPVKFRVDFFGADGAPRKFVLDRRDNRSDRNIDFAAFEPVGAGKARITILRGDNRINHGLVQATFFGGAA